MARPRETQAFSVHSAKDEGGSPRLAPLRVETEVSKHSLWPGHPCSRVEGSSDTAVVKAKRHGDAHSSPGEGRGVPQPPTKETWRPQSTHARSHHNHLWTAWLSHCQCCIHCPEPRRGPKWPSQDAKPLTASPRPVLVAALLCQKAAARRGNGTEGLKGQRDQSTWPRQSTLPTSRPCGGAAR